MKTTHSLQVPLSYGLTVKELKNLIDTLPESARISVSILKGDRPGLPDQQCINIKWYVEI